MGDRRDLGVVRDSPEILNNMRGDAEHRELVARSPCPTQTTAPSRPQATMSRAPARGDRGRRVGALPTADDRQRAPSSTPEPADKPAPQSWARQDSLGTRSSSGDRAAGEAEEPAGPCSSARRP